MDQLRQLHAASFRGSVFDSVRTLQEQDRWRSPVDGKTREVLNVLPEIEGQGSFGTVYELSDFPDKCVKIEELRQGLRIYDEEFYRSCALTIELGRIGVGPPCFYNLEHGPKSGIVDGIVLRVGRGIFSQSTFWNARYGITVMQKYTSDLMRFICENQRLALRNKLNLETRITNLIDKMVAVGIVCTDMKPTNILVRYEQNKISDVRLADFDVEFCYENEKTAPEYARLALQMELCLTTYLFLRKELSYGVPVVLFASESKLLLNRLIENPGYVYEQIKQPLIETHYHYCVKMYEAASLLDRNGNLVTDIGPFAMLIGKIEERAKELEVDRESIYCVEVVNEILRRMTIRWRNACHYVHIFIKNLVIRCRTKRRLVGIFLRTAFNFEQKYPFFATFHYEFDFSYLDAFIHSKNWERPYKGKNGEIISRKKRWWLEEGKTNETRDQYNQKIVRIALEGQ